MLLYLAKYGTYQCRVWALIDTADTATGIPSFTAPAYLVTESYGGKVLDSFSIKPLNRFTYLPETQAPGLFEQALATNVAVSPYLHCKNKGVMVTPILGVKWLCENDTTFGVSNAGHPRLVS